MERATARARKAFKYPSEDEDESGRDEMDEEEQESVLKTLNTASAATNDLYILLFTLLPLVSSVIFLITLFSPSRHTRPHHRLLSLLSITSLLLTAAHMLLTPFARSAPFSFYPSSTTTSSDGPNSSRNATGATLTALAYRRRQAAATRSRQQPSASSSATTSQTLLDRALATLNDLRDTLEPEVVTGGPLLKALPWLNLGVVAVVTFAMFGLGRTGDGFWIVCVLPPLMFALVVFVEWTIVGEEVVLRDLGGMRYGYKGA